MNRTIEALRLATATVELHTGNGAQEQVHWPRDRNGDVDYDATAQECRAALRQAPEEIEAGLTAARAEGRLGAYQEFATELQAIGFGRVDEVTGEEEAISGADCVEALSVLYGRVLGILGTEIVDRDADERVTVTSGTREARVKDGPKAEALEPLRDALDSLAEGADPGDFDAHEALRPAYAALERAEKAEALLRVLARMQTEDEDTGATYAERSGVLDDLIAEARRVRAGQQQHAGDSRYVGPETITIGHPGGAGTVGTAPESRGDPRKGNLKAEAAEILRALADALDDESGNEDGWRGWVQSVYSTLDMD